jgi:hypothetical protein
MHILLANHLALVLIVNYSRVGVNVYVPLRYGFGISGGYSSYIAGRNLGASSGGYGALIFSF